MELGEAKQHQMQRSGRLPASQGSYRLWYKRPLLCLYKIVFVWGIEMEPCAKVVSSMEYSFV